MTWLSSEQVLFIHSRVIDETGGAHGVLDLGLLESALARPRATFDGEKLYPDIFHEAASLLESLIGNHPFIDGNKRTAIVSAAVFLQGNGYVLQAGQEEIVEFALAIANGKYSLLNSAVWLNKHCVREQSATG